MKIRLIITDRTWEYRLHVVPQEPGKYYATLRALDGAALRPAVCTGAFASLDVITTNAQALYLQLVAMHEEVSRERAVAAIEAPCT